MCILHLRLNFLSILGIYNLILVSAYDGQLKIIDKAFHLFCYQYLVIKYDYDILSKNDKISYEGNSKCRKNTQEKKSH